MPSCFYVVIDNMNPEWLVTIRSHLIVLHSISAIEPLMRVMLILIPLLSQSRNRLAKKPRRLFLWANYTAFMDICCTPRPVFLLPCIPHFWAGVITLWFWPQQGRSQAETQKSLEALDCGSCTWRTSTGHWVTCTANDLSRHCIRSSHTDPSHIEIQRQRQLVFFHNLEASFSFSSQHRGFCKKHRPELFKQRRLFFLTVP